MTTAAMMTADTLPTGAAQPDASGAPTLRKRLTDWIWHIHGSVPLDPGQSPDEAFDRLDPLFRTTGTARERNGDTLTFSKRDAAAQDRMAVFSGGMLWIEAQAEGLVLRYRLLSKALLYCFLAPLLFLAFAQATVALGKLESPKIEAKKPKAKKTPAPLNPIDKALGAPAPEQPKKKGGDDDKDKKPSPTAGYVFAGIFATLYAIGRVFEARRVGALFRRSLRQG
ncbi:hypothetical protein [Sphingomonas sp. CV7422]|nr:hypothetical protein [Sphingomonas sp. CV7422]EZP55758.1 hypothetical protein BW41_00837 [Sphingomonas sp. RIT328]